MTVFFGYGHIVNFMTGFDWWKTNPHDELVDHGNYCLADPGHLYRRLSYPRQQRHTPTPARNLLGRMVQPAHGRTNFNLGRIRTLMVLTLLPRTPKSGPSFFKKK